MRRAQCTRRGRPSLGSPGTVCHRSVLYGHRALKRGDPRSASIQPTEKGGDLAPGVHLVERVLAGRFQISRTPVREALKALVQEGLAVEGGRRGIRVRRLSIDHLIQAYIVREHLEGLAARLAALEARPEPLRTMRISVEQMDEAVREKCPIQYDTYHERFHNALREASGNAYLVSFLRELAAFRTHMVALD